TRRLAAAQPRGTAEDVPEARRHAVDGAGQSRINAQEAMTAYCKLLLTVAAAGLLLQAAGARGAAPLPNYAHDKTLGVGTCSSSLCHGAIETWKGSHVLQNEYVTWSRSDKHHLRAYTVLLSDRSKEIAKKLNLPRPPHLTTECLDCHTH